METTAIRGVGKERKRRLRSQHNYTPDPSERERGGGESKTVPDETLTIKEILQKYVKGQNMADVLSRETGYNDGDTTFDDPDLDAINRLDKVDRIETQRQVQEDIAEYERQLEREQQAIEAAKQKTDEKQQKSSEKNPSTSKSKKEGAGRQEADRNTASRTNAGKEDGDSSTDD